MLVKNKYVFNSIYFIFLWFWQWNLIWNLDFVITGIQLHSPLLSILLKGHFIIEFLSLLIYFVWNFFIKKLNLSKIKSKIISIIKLFEDKFSWKNSSFFCLIFFSFFFCFSIEEISDKFEWLISSPYAERFSWFNLKSSSIISSELIISSNFISIASIDLLFSWIDESFFEIFSE